MAAAPADPLSEFLRTEQLPVPLAENRERLEEYARLVLSDLERVTGDAERALLEGDAEAVAQAGHALRGAALHTRNVALKEVATALAATCAGSDPEESRRMLRRLRGVIAEVKETLSLREEERENAGSDPKIAR
jgi:hypothetical protein